MEDNLKKRSFLGEGIIILVFTCLSYYIYYSFYISYLSYFGVSENFLEFDVIKIIAPAFAIFSFIFLFFIVFKMFEDYFFKKASKMGRLNTLFFIGLFVVSLLVFSLTDSLSKALFTAISFLIIFFILKYLVRFSLYLADKINKNKKQIKTVNIELNKKISDIFFVTIMLLYFIIFTSPLIGQMSAERQKNFELTKINDKEFVILGRFKDSLLISELNNYNKELIGGIGLLSINEIQEKNYKIYSKEVGPLTQKFSVLKGFDFAGLFRCSLGYLYNKTIVLIDKFK